MTTPLKPLIKPVPVLATLPPAPRPTPSPLVPAVAAEVETGRAPAERPRRRSSGIRRVWGPPPPPGRRPPRGGPPVGAMVGELVPAPAAPRISPPRKLWIKPVPVLATLPPAKRRTP